ncbi:MAG: tetratricopeptide repeat protein [Magnetococcales bacterium]|nr:tetratricopeptide repeat protein [Magnetococcales bacterium]
MQPNRVCANEAAFERMHLYFWQGRTREALNEVTLALIADPENIDLINLAAACHMTLGDAARAEACWQEALRLQPDSARTLNNLGHFYQAGQRLSEAEAAYREAIRVQPDHALAHKNLGILLIWLERLAEAEACCRQSLRIDPRDAETHNNLGVALRRQEREREARIAFLTATHLQPDYPDAFANLGRLLTDMEYMVEAEAAFREVVRLCPDSPAALCDLGYALLRLKRPDEAEVHFRTAARLAPEDADALLPLARLLLLQHRLDEAAVLLTRILALAPNHGEAMYEMARMHDRREDPIQAEAYYRMTLLIAPDDADACFHLGILLQSLNRPDEAVAALQDAVRLRPDHVETGAALLHQRRLVCSWSGLADEEALLLERAGRDAGGAVQPFIMLALPATRAQQLENARRYAQRFAMVSATFDHQPALRQADGRLRIGYLSDIGDNPLGTLFFEALERHDRSRFEIIAYALGPQPPEPFRSRLLAACDRVLALQYLTDREAAQRIHDDGVHILVDLLGYIQNSRPRILALRPAPIQVNYLGFPGTLGAGFYDYLIADRFIIPPEHREDYQEQVVYLPDCYQPADNRRLVGAPMIRAQTGLPAQGFVFCCFNNSYKFTPAFFDIWMRLLQRVSGSVLWLLEDTTPLRENLLHEAARRGVGPERLVFAPRIGNASHLARHRLADLFLDNLPVNAHTGANDSLWAGVPVVTCVGETFAGRVAGSLLHAAGLPELVTHDLAAYEALALRLALEPERLRAIRERLTRLRETAPLFQTDRFVANLEEAYRRMAAALPQEIPAVSKGVKYVSMGDHTGYAVAARQYLRLLRQGGIPITWHPVILLGKGGISIPFPACPEPQLADIWQRAIPYDTVIVHLVPDYFPEWIARERRPGRRMIGYTVWEMDRLPTHWPAILNQFDAVLVPCAWNRTRFRDAGVTVPIHVVPHLPQFAPGQRAAPMRRLPIDAHALTGRFVFYTIGTWIARKAPFLVMEAFAKAFAPDAPVALVVKTGAQDNMRLQPVAPGSELLDFPPLADTLAQWRREHPVTPPILVIDDDRLSEDEMLALHERGDCYVSLARSEGWGLGAFDAAMRGTPVIMTGHGGQLDFLDADLAWLVGFAMVPAEEPAWHHYFLPGDQWAEADLEHAAACMRAVFRDPDAARARARVLGERLAERFSAERIGQAWRNALQRGGES